MPGLMRRRLQDEGGFTLIEMLVTLSIGSVVLWALVTVFVTTVGATARVDDRVDTEQRVRVAIDRSTTLLNSQVCLDDGTAPIASGSTGSSVSFYADIAARSNNASSARLEQLVFDPTARTLTELRYAGTTVASGVTSQNLVARDVIAPADGSSVFTYWAFTGTPPSADATPLDATSGLTAAAAATVVHVRISLRAVPSRTGTADARTTALSGDVYAATLDPSQPKEGPQCGF